jgi:hypothetical protein
MEFELKSYKVFKIKSYLKKNTLFFFYTTTSLNLKNWLLIEQTLKVSNLNYYRLFNTLTRKTLKKSVYINYKQLIHSLTMFVSPKSATTLKLKKLINLETVLTMISIKLNNKIYSVCQFKKLNLLNYNTNMLLLFHSLISHLTYSFRINTSQKRFSK